MALGIAEPRPDTEPGRYQATGRSAAVEHVEAGAVPARRLELWGITALFALIYGLVGYHVVIEQQVVVFDALDRLTRAYLVWHNDPPKLAAVGFVFPPLTTVMFLPFAIVKSLATSLVALPVSSAIFAGLTLATLDQILARCSMRPALRWPLLALVAANPLFAFYATNGMAESLYLLLLAFSLYCAMTWFVTRQPRFLVGAGLALAMAGLTRYSFVLWTLLLAALIGIVLRRRRARSDEVEGSVILFITPAVYAMVVWTLFNALIVGRPFGWITRYDEGIPAAAGATEFGALDVVGGLFELVWAAAPAAFVAIPWLLWAFFARRDDFSLLLALLMLTSLVVIGVDAAAAGDLSELALRDATPLLIVIVAGAAWAYHEAREGRGQVWAAAMAMLAISIPITWSGMSGYEHQNLERAFVRAIGSGEKNGGPRGGIEPERRMAAYINRNISREGSVLTDNARTFGVMLLSGRPELFFDRIDRGDDAFRAALRTLPPSVDYVLVSRDVRADLGRDAFPGLTEDQSDRAAIEFETDRYVLARVR